MERCKVIFVIIEMLPIPVPGTSVAEQPRFCAAPASDVRGPGADSGSRLKRAASGGSGYPRGT